MSESTAASIDSDMSSLEVRPAGGTSMSKWLSCWDPKNEANDDDDDHDGDGLGEYNGKPVPNVIKEDKHHRHDDKHQLPTNKTTTTVTTQLPITADNNKTDATTPTEVQPNDDKTQQDDENVTTDKPTKHDTVPPKKSRNTTLFLILLIITIIGGGTIAFRNNTIKQRTIRTTHQTSIMMLDWIDDYQDYKIPTLIQDNIQRLYDTTKPVEQPKALEEEKPKEKKKIHQKIFGFISSRFGGKNKNMK